MPWSCNVQNKVSESPRATLVTHLEYRVHLREPHFARGIGQEERVLGNAAEESTLQCVVEGPWPEKRRISTG